LVLFLVCLGQFMVVLDLSIVNVALPSIARDLHFTASGLQWVVNAYTLAFAGFLLLGGRGDGHREREGGTSTGGGASSSSGWGCSRWPAWPVGWPRIR
jgi:MFS family permease